MANTITILMPHAETATAATRLAPRLTSLEGKRVGILDNDLWQSMHVIADELGKVLRDSYGVVSTETVTYHYVKGFASKEYQDKLEGLGRRVDAVISGLGN
jgi:hypothetical protein